MELKGGKMSIKQIPEDWHLFDDVILQTTIINKINGIVQEVNNVKDFIEQIRARAEKTIKELNNE